MVASSVSRARTPSARAPASPCLLPRRRARPQQRDLIIHVLNRVLELEAQTPRRGDLTAHCGLGDHEVRLRRIDRRLLDRDLDVIRLGVEFDEHVAFFHPIVVLHKHARHLSVTRGATNVT